MCKTCHKNNKWEKKLTLLNEIYLRKITYLYVGLSTKISICLPAFIKVGKTPATQNLVLEQYAVKIGNSTLFLYDNYINLP
jgi:hypothetical protein